jgi:hypothetical protein
LKTEGSELSEKIGQLKMSAEDGKMRLTDVADTEQLFMKKVVTVKNARQIAKSKGEENQNSIMN